MSRLKIIAVEEVPLQGANIYLKESFFVLMLQVGAFFLMPKTVIIIKEEPINLADIVTTEVETELQ